MNNDQTAKIHTGKQVGKKGTDEMRVEELQNADMGRGRCYTANTCLYHLPKRAAFSRDTSVCSDTGMKRRLASSCTHYERLREKDSSHNTTHPDSSTRLEMKIICLFLNSALQ